MSSGASTTRFLYDGDKLVMEYNGAGGVTRAYVHGPGVDEPLVLYEADQRRFLHADHQGSIIALNDDAGTPVAIDAYDAWGIPNAGNVGRFGYTGQAWLPELGLWYYKARFYSPTTGRFMQVDPIGYDDQINLYAYVGNDPLNRIDPTGLADLNLTGEGDPINSLGDEIDFGGAFTIFAHSGNKLSGATAAVDQRAPGNTAYLAPRGLLAAAEGQPVPYRRGQLTVMIICNMGSFAQAYADKSQGRVIASNGLLGIRREGKETVMSAYTGFYRYDPNKNKAVICRERDPLQFRDACRTYRYRTAKVQEILSILPQ